jgi:hypothetical protein
MTFNISEYTPDVRLPDYKQTDYSLELELATLAQKNTEQEKSLSVINNLKSTALNIPMLNMEGMKRLQEYNKTLADQLSGDLGDLTDVENQNKVAGIFQTMASDDQLIKASRLSKQYLDESSMIQQMKSSGRKDSGYDPINEYVWMNWDGGMNDFAKKGLLEVNDPNFQPLKYTPYKDLRTPLANLTKLLHEDTVSREQQTLDEKGNPTGYLTKHTYGGVSPERVRALFEEQMGQDGMAQIETLSKYQILRNRESGSVESLFNQYNSFASGSIKTQENQLSETTQRISYLTEKSKKDSTPEDEKSQIFEELGVLQRNKTVLESNIGNLKQTLKSKDDFLKMGNNELLSYVYEVNKDEKIKNAVSAFSWKKDMQELSPDATYLAAKRIDAMLAQTRIREEGADNRMRLSYQMKGSSKAGEKDESLWSTGDISKNPAELLSSYDRLNTLQDEFSKKTDNILMSPSLDLNTISQKNWSSFYDKHKGNYYVEMFDVFKNTSNLAYDVNGKPNIESFRLWLQDAEKNPSTLTQGKIQQYRADQYIANYLTSELNVINGALRADMKEAEALLPYARDEKGNPMSKEDFYAGKDVYFWVPTSKKNPNEPYTGNYQKKTLDEVLYDLNKAGSETEKNTGEYQVYNSITNRPYISGISVGTYLDNDLGLRQALSNYNAKAKDPQVKSVLMERLPQWEQFGYSQTSDKDQIALYEGQISASAKNTNPSFRTLLSSGGIESIAIPKGSGNKGIVKFKGEYAKELEEANVWLPTQDGNVSEKVVPGRAYLFDTQPIDGRNPLLNMAAQKQPYQSSLLGYSYKISPLSNGDKVVTITKPDGTTIEPVMGGNNQKDITEIISQVEAFIVNQQQIKK